MFSGVGINVSTIGKKEVDLVRLDQILLYAVGEWRFGERYLDIPRATTVKCCRTEFDCVQYLGDMRKRIGIVLRSKIVKCCLSGSFCYFSTQICSHKHTHGHNSPANWNEYMI